MIAMEIPSWFISFCTTLLAAFFGYLIAVKKFKKEKLWQEKYESYQAVLSALEAMLLWANETYCREKMIPTKGTHAAVGDGKQSFSEARRVIAKTTCIGKLLLCQEVIDELDILETELWNENFRADEQNYYPNTFEESEAISEHAKNIEKIVQPRLEKIIELAKKDLQ
ncbi:MAG: hypothetical protein OIF55_07385 [Amphritea sp.]|nr:hypothetical protein [Amphritea sp.]